LNWIQVYNYTYAEPPIALWLSITPLIIAAASLVIYVALKSEGHNPKKTILGVVFLIFVVSFHSYSSSVKSFNELVDLVESKTIQKKEGLLRSKKVMIGRQHGEQVVVGDFAFFRADPSRFSKLTGCFDGFVPKNIQEIHVRISYMVFENAGPEISWQSKDGKRFDVFCIISIEIQDGNET